ncbi:zinc finger protein zas1 [Xylariaceae sp. FL0016]|nr:zinc finger protein zas1 [Xylariaceae sp. FL0016]
MASEQPSQGAGAGVSGPAYKRASRKGAPKKYACQWPRCDKVYSRAEHLKRHELNHRPQEIYRCDVPDCTQMFVRPDLLARHKKRHSSSYIPRNRASSFSMPETPMSPKSNGLPTPVSAVARALPRPVPPVPLATTHTQQPANAPRNASVLLTSDSPVLSHAPPLPLSQTSPIATNANWTARTQTNAIDYTKPSNYYMREQAAPLHNRAAPTFAPFQTSGQVPEASDMDVFGWLFEPHGDFSIANLPFAEPGLESALNNNIHYDRESLTSRSQVAMTPPRHPDISEDHINEYRRREILHWLSASTYRARNSKYDSKFETLMRESGGDNPGLSLEFFRDCIRHYWDFVSPRIPIIHQPTFSYSRCNISLLLVMIAMGAAQIHSQSGTSELEAYKTLADLIIRLIRFDILPSEDASPPVALWVAQALLLIEFYEKMYSSRSLHERAHIYHSMTLTLLRRGNPLIGRAGSESPPEMQNGAEHSAGSDANLWWVRWAETESMHRVVFAAFMMDIVHAAMFGHAADMAPHEIRLPLPCDEALWCGATPETVRSIESNLRMYGVKPVSFLDGLKRAIHGKEVKTHSFGRMIIMCGLLSVGWHLRHRETHLKWLELGASTSETRDKWCRMLLKAFDDWKVSFDGATRPSDTGLDGHGQQSSSNGMIQSAALLYHLAHISLYIDIVDCQVYAKAKNLLGRKVSTRDYSNVVARMDLWAVQATTRRAVLHAFKVLHRILVERRPRRSSGYQTIHNSLHGIHYSTRNETDPHRPWIMYYATLSIWSFVMALNHSQHKGRPPLSPNMRRGSNNVSDYLSRVAVLNELDLPHSSSLYDGLPELLDVVSAIASESHSELLKEACTRLDTCKNMVYGGVS